MDRNRRDYSYVGLQGVLFLAYLLPVRLIDVSVPPALRWLALGVVAFGGLLCLFALLRLGRQLSPFPTPVTAGKLITTGVFAYVRHPIYAGILLSAVGGSIFTQSVYRLIITVLLLMLFYFKSRYEEELLLQQFPAYTDYRRRVGRFGPFLIGRGRR